MQLARLWKLKLKRWQNHRLGKQMVAARERKLMWERIAKEQKEKFYKGLFSVDREKEYLAKPEPILEEPEEED